MQITANHRNNNDNMDITSEKASFTVASSYAKGLLAAFGINGVPSESLIAGTAITPELLAVPENRVALCDLQVIWARAIEISGSDCLGLDVGQAMPAGHWGLIEMLAQNSDTLGDAFDAALNYWRLVSDTGKRFTVSEGGGLITFSFWSPFFDLPQANETDMVYFERRIKLLLGSDINPVAYQFSHKPHGELTDKDYARYLSAPIEFGCEVNSVTLQAEVFQRKITSSSSELKLVVKAIAEKQLVLLDAAKSVGQKVQTLVNGGTDDIDNVASLLNMSTRTLQRRLKEEDSAFKHIVNEVKKGKAEVLFQARIHSIQEIGFLLGYQNERTFYDAVQRWFGTSPSGAIALLANVD
ncbi:hypothetical protein A9Q99_12900 [Gammaproteobacteria bacterium 45_16_T64]|nr:hypothetical protein A9Q99_12900 [Gammaproteobacteria bacterium 45_16_T64]